MDELDSGTFKMFWIDDSYDYKEAEVAIRLTNVKGQIVWMWKFGDVFKPAESDELENLYNEASRDE